MSFADDLILQVVFAEFNLQEMQYNYQSYALLNFCIDYCAFVLIVAQARSAFGRRGTRRSQTARAWPRAAQHKSMAFFEQSEVLTNILDN